MIHFWIIGIRKKSNIHFDPFATFVKNIFETQSQLNSNIYPVDQIDFSNSLKVDYTDFPFLFYFESGSNFDFGRFNFSIHFLFMYGGTQTLFRDLPKFSNVGKIFTSSCSALKIVPSHEIGAHGPVPEPKNRIRHFEV